MLEDMYLHHVILCCLYIQVCGCLTYVYYGVFNPLLVSLFGFVIGRMEPGALGLLDKCLPLICTLVARV